MDIHTFMYIVISGLVLAMVGFVWSVGCLVETVIEFIRKEYK